jgi:hypothetical protein
MNELATDQNRSLCNRLNIEASILDELLVEATRLAENKFADFTDYDNSTIAWSVGKLEEAVSNVKLALVNLKKLLG